MAAGGAQTGAQILELARMLENLPAEDRDKLLSLLARQAAPDES